MKAGCMYLMIRKMPRKNPDAQSSCLRTSGRENSRRSQKNENGRSRAK